MGSSSKPVQPQAPSASTTAADYNTMLQNQWEQQLKYAPLEAAQQVQLAQQYALPYGEAMKAAQEAMYPGTTAIQEKLANQALTGMESGMSPDVRQQYLSDLRANLGTNVGSPIGATETARGLAQMNEDWKRYYQNLGLSVTNRQPLTQASAPSYTSQMSQVTPGHIMSMNQSNYGTAMGLYGNQLQNYQNMNNPMNWISAGGNVLQGVSGQGSGFMGWGKR